MTSPPRLRLKGDLCLESDLHIGASDQVERPASKGDSPPDDTPADKQPLMTPVQRGIDGRPVIPGSSLKGVLKSLLPEDRAKAIFGAATQHTEDIGGTIAKLWLTNALLHSASDKDLRGLSSQPPDKGVFVRAGVALDPDRGGPTDNQLFSREFVAAGARFTFAATWFGEASDDLIEVLAILSRGVRAGAATSKGNGRLRLALDTLKIDEETIDTDGCPRSTAWDKGQLAALCKRVQDTRPAYRKSWQRYGLTLECDGPFISKRGMVKDGETEIVAPLEQDGKPILWREGVRGALRSRARWLSEVARAKGEAAFARDADLPMDDRSLDQVLDGRRHLRQADIAKLSPVERLFGVTGKKGHLEVTSLTCTGTGTATGGTQKITSTSLDRISGGGRDGFLFTTEVYWGARFDVTLHLSSDAAQDEKDLLREVLLSLGEDGIDLGHGAAKGFGWFDVTLTETPWKEGGA